MTGLQAMAASAIVSHEDIRAELEATRSAFHDLLNSLSDDDLKGKGPEVAWTVKELLTHLIVVLSNTPQIAESARRGKGMYNFPPAIGHRISRLITSRKARGQNRQSLARQYDSAHEATLKVLEQVREDEWSRGARFFGEGFSTVESVFRYPIRHFQEHMAHIRHILGQVD